MNTGHTDVNATYHHPARSQAPEQGRELPGSQRQTKAREKMSIVDVGWPLPGRAFVGNLFDFYSEWLHEHYSAEPGSTQLGDREGSGPQPPPNPHFHRQPNQLLQQNPLLPNTPQNGLACPRGTNRTRSQRGEGIKYHSLRTTETIFSLKK